MLDDLTRLRDVVSLLVDTDHYVPSILFINWDSKGLADDILNVLDKHVRDGKIEMASEVALTSDDPDFTFAEGLRTLDLDLNGERVERLELAGMHT